MSDAVMHKATARGLFRNRRRLVTVGRVLFGIGVLLIWQWVSALTGSLVMSPPTRVFARIVELIVTGGLYHNLGVTLLEALVGLTVGTLLGIGIPFLLHASPRVTEATLPYFRGAMGVPKLALAPLFMLWFGIGLASKFALITLIVFFLVFEPAFAGLHAIDQRLVTMARILGASHWQVTRKIIWKSLLPFIFGALKSALPWSVAAAVVGEFISGNAGLGFMINQANDLMDITGVFAGIIIVTTLVVTLDIALNRVRDQALSWRAVDSQTTL